MQKQASAAADDAQLRQTTSSTGSEPGWHKLASVQEQQVSELDAATPTYPGASPAVQQKDTLHQRHASELLADPQEGTLEQLYPVDRESPRTELEAATAVPELNFDKAHDGQTDPHRLSHMNEPDLPSPGQRASAEQLPSDTIGTHAAPQDESPQQLHRAASNAPAEQQASKADAEPDGHMSDNAQIAQDEAPELTLPSAEQLSEPTEQPSERDSSTATMPQDESGHQVFAAEEVSAAEQHLSEADADPDDGRPAPAWAERDEAGASSVQEDPAQQQTAHVESSAKQQASEAGAESEGVGAQEGQAEAPDTSQVASPSSLGVQGHEAPAEQQPDEVESAQSGPSAEQQASEAGADSEGGTADGLMEQGQSPGMAQLALPSGLGAQQHEGTAEQPCADVSGASAALRDTSTHGQDATDVQAPAEQHLTDAVAIADTQGTGIERRITLHLMGSEQLHCCCSCPGLAARVSCMGFASQ